MIQRFIVGGLLFALAASVLAHGDRTALVSLRAAPKAFEVARVLAPPSRGVEELRFADVFSSPVGPRGLEITPRLRELDGRRVRLVGYMVRADVAGGFLLSPLPVELGDADESLADDLPPSALLVELPREVALRSAHMPGLIQVTGRLRVGRAENAALPGRAFAARIELDAALERALRKANK